MKKLAFLFSSTLALGSAALLSGCGDNGDSTTSSSAGNAGSAGSPAGGSAGSPAGGSGGSGDSAGNAGSAGQAGSGASAGSGGAAGSGGSGGSGGAGGSSSADCAALSESIAEQTGGVKTCTTVVRLDYQTKVIKGFRILCDPYGATNEMAARATAQADTGYGGGQFISGPAPEDEYVFFMSAGDFGGSSAVNARSGKTVFGGSTVWNGTGELIYPPPGSFEPASKLGKDCAGSSPSPIARGFRLDSGQALAMNEVTAAVAVVWDTALPVGLWKSGYVFDVMVLLYPPSVGAFDPTSAEWEVLVNSGWLE